jgi:hypothetical protein
MDNVAKLLPLDRDAQVDKTMSSSRTILRGIPTQVILNANSSASLLPFMGGKAAKIQQASRKRATPFAV